MFYKLISNSVDKVIKAISKTEFPNKWSLEICLLNQCRLYPIFINSHSTGMLLRKTFVFNFTF